MYSFSIYVTEGCLGFDLGQALVSNVPATAVAKLALSGMWINCRKSIGLIDTAR